MKSTEGEHPVTIEMSVTMEDMIVTMEAEIIVTYDPENGPEIVRIEIDDKSDTPVSGQFIFENMTSAQILALDKRVRQLTEGWWTPVEV